MITGKQLPQAIKLEEAIIGAMMLNGKLSPTIIAYMKVDDFYKESHRLIFSAAKTIYDKGQVVDLLTLFEATKSLGVSDKIGGISYLMELSNKVASDVNVPTHMQIVKDLAIKRKTIQAAAEVMKLGYDATISADELVTQLHGKMISIQGGGGKNDRTAEDIGMTTYNEIITPSEGGISGIPLFGIHELDSLTNGAEPGDLIIIAARPSMGKSMLMNTSIANVTSDGHKPMVWGLEMTSEKNLKMYLSASENLDYGKITRSTLPENQHRVVKNAIDNYISEKSLFFIDQGGYNIGQMRAKVTQYKDIHDIDILYIDHGGYITKNMIQGRSNDIEEISIITKTLKGLAKELKIPIVLLWQLSRDVVKRGGSRKPVLSDLRGSGTLEEDLDKAIFLHRDAYYLKSETPIGLEYHAQADVAKHRGGEIGVVDLKFRPDRARFEEWVEDPDKPFTMPGDIGDKNAGFRPMKGDLPF